MRPRLLARALLVLLALVFLWPAAAWAQSSVRIFGTDAAGAAIPVVVNSDGSIRLSMAVSTFTFEGSTVDDNQTTLDVVDPTADRTVLLPNASGTVALVENTLAVFAATTSAQLAGVLTNETGTGVAVFSISPAFTGAPTFGNADTSAGTIKFLEDSDNGTNAVTLSGAQSTADVTVTLPAITGTLAVLGGGQTFSAPFYVANADTSAGAIFFYEDSDNGTNTAKLIGPASTGDVVITLPAATGTVALTGNKLSDFAATSSAELTGVISDETGSGALVFGTAPIFTTSVTAGLIASQDVIKLLPVTDDDRFTYTVTVADLSADHTFTLPNADITAVDITKLLGITNGTGAASKALVLDANADITAGLRSVVASGDVKAATFHVGTDAGVDKTCTAADAIITVKKGLITAITCTTAEPTPDAAPISARH